MKAYFKTAAALSALLLTTLCACGKLDLTMDTGESGTTAPTVSRQPEQSLSDPDIKTDSGSSSEEVFKPDDDFVECTAAICYDLTEDKTIYEKNADKPIYPASVTKLLTALVATEYLERDQTCTVGSEIYLVAEDSSRAWLEEGEHYTRNDLLTAMLAPSGNDAAYTVAANVVHTVYGGDIADSEITEYFSVLMNEYAKKLGCTDTFFTVPDGYHDDRHVTTCADMLKIAKAAALNADIVAITSDPAPVVYDLEGYTHSWENGNLLLTDPYTDYETYGLKTGYTDEAGFCFAGLSEMDGKRIITLTFGCGVEYRYEDTLKLMDLGFGIYDSEKNYRERYWIEPEE